LAFVFARDIAGNASSSWSQRAKLGAKDGAARAYFGSSVAISRDTIVAGAYKADGIKGAAYIFTRDVAGAASSAWTQRAKLAAADGAARDSFGSGVAVSGNTVVAGASGDGDKVGRGGLHSSTFQLNMSRLFLGQFDATYIIPPKVCDVEPKCG